MIRIKDTQYASTSALLSSAIRTAEYYGFRSLDDMPRARANAGRAGFGKPEATFNFARRDERMLPVAARKLLSVARKPHEVILGWRITRVPGTPASVSFELHVFGTQSMIAEALLVVVAHAIAQEAGLSECTTSINNIGTTESNGRYTRDVGHYLRKHIETISPNLRVRAAEDPLGTFVTLIERSHPIISRAPQSMEYLNEEERRQLWDFLEYLEVYGLPYELNSHILGSRDCWSHTLFEISSVDPETGARIQVALGGRYDPVVSRMARASSPSTMISITCETQGSQAVRRATPGVPAIYFAQLSDTAKRQSLTVLEMLRKAEIPVHHQIWHERMNEQMLMAAELAVPYILILGHKEVVDGTIIVREVATNSQDAIPLPELTSYLKRRRFFSPKNVSA